MPERTSGIINDAHMHDNDGAIVVDKWPRHVWRCERDVLGGDELGKSPVAFLWDVAMLGELGEDDMLVVGITHLDGELDTHVPSLVVTGLNVSGIGIE